jgi:DNA-binding NarL/FixJ family response regulator
MKHPLFITARVQPLPQWQEAFPNARLIRGQKKRIADPATLAEASVIWLHVAGDDQTAASWVSAVKAVAQDVPVVVLSNLPQDAQGLAALGAGASGYCSAIALPAVLKQVASVVAKGGLWVGPQLMRRLMQGLAARGGKTAHPALDILSQRERQVALAVSQGAANKEIARLMGITERTVKAHLSAIFEKLGVRDRMQLSLLVNGIEDPPRPAKKAAA